MGLFENFPYTNFHELNLDWIVKTVKDVSEKLDYVNATIADDVQKYVEILYKQGLITTPYNVMSHGADNTGRLDCTSIIQNVIDTFGICFIPNGTYKLQSPLIIRSGCLVLGESATDTILSASGDCFVTENYASLVDTGNADAPHGFVVKNLHMTGSDSAVGMKLYAYHYRIYDCFMEHFETGIVSEYNKSLGFAPAGCTPESYIMNSLVQKMTSTCIELKGPSDSYIVNTCFSNAPSGIVVKGNTTSWPNGVNIINCHGYTIGRVNNNACYELHAPANLYDCTGESAGSGVSVKTNAGVNIHGGYFYNNWFYGVHINTSSSVIIDDVILRRNKTAEICNEQDLKDSYIHMTSLGSIVKMFEGAGNFDSATTDLKIYSNLNVNIVNRPKRLPIETVDVSNLSVGTAIQVPENYSVMVYQTGGTGIYVGVGFGNQVSVGDMNVFFVPAGGSWSCAKVPTTVKYQPILF